MPIFILIALASVISTPTGYTHSSLLKMSEIGRQDHLENRESRQESKTRDNNALTRPYGPVPVNQFYAWISKRRKLAPRARLAANYPESVLRMAINSTARRRTPTKAVTAYSTGRVN